MWRFRIYNSAVYEHTHIQKLSLRLSVTRKHEHLIVINCLTHLFRRKFAATTSKQSNTPVHKHHSALPRHFSPVHFIVLLTTILLRFTVNTGVYFHNRLELCGVSKSTPAPGIRGSRLVGIERRPALPRTSLNQFIIHTEAQHPLQP